MKNNKKHSRTTSKSLEDESYAEISSTKNEILTTLCSPILEVLDSPLGETVVRNLNSSLEHFGFLKRYNLATYISELLYGGMSLQNNPALQDELQTCTVCDSKQLYCPYCTPENRSHAWIERITQVLDNQDSPRSDEEFWKEVCVFSLSSLIEQLNMERMQ